MRQILILTESGNLNFFFEINGFLPKKNFSLKFNYAHQMSDDIKIN